MAEQHSINVVAEEPQPSFFSNVVAIIGFIILIVVIIWGLIHLASLSKGWFSNLFAKQTPAIQITVPNSVNSGNAFNVSWKYSTTDKGNYALVYTCTKGLSVKLGGSFTVPCGAAFTVGATTSVQMTPTLAGTTTSPMQLSVIFLPSATSSKQAQGTAKVTINSGNASIAVQSTTPTKTTATTATTKPAATRVATRYKSPADLAVRIIAIGVIDPSTGQFVNRAPMSQYEMVAAEFDISNVGGTSSGTYYFSAVLPTINGYTYSSPAQAPLAPSDHVINTLKWNQSAQSGAFSVTVSGGSEANNTNNYASQWVGSTYTNYNTNPSYNVYVPPQQPTTYYPQYTY